MNPVSNPSKRLLTPDTDADLLLRQHLDNSPKKGFIMTAGAGSGKTTSLIKALSHVASTQGDLLRLREQQVACITYTEIAVEEILRDVHHSPLFHVSTIHSFLWTVIRPFQHDIRSWVLGEIDRKVADALGKIRSERTRERTKMAARLELARLRAQREHIPTTFTYGTGSSYDEGVLGHSDVLKMVPALILEKPLLQKLVAKRFPYVFVDESQDTDTTFVEALKVIYGRLPMEFCVGFFGDPMQQIYMTGIGDIELGDDWLRITKRENFRSPPSVLDVINNIRKTGDGLQQKSGQVQADTLESVPEGTARLFVVPADDRTDQTVTTIRKWLAEDTDDPKWLSDDTDDVKVMVIVHRAAAMSLGFGDLYSALNDDAPDSIKQGFLDGTTWVLRPFLNFVLPIVENYAKGNAFAVMELLRSNCPLLEQQQVVGRDLSKTLSGLKMAVDRLTQMLSVNANATMLDVLALLHEQRLIRLDDRWTTQLERVSGRELVDESETPTAHSNSDNINPDIDPDDGEYEKLCDAIDVFATCSAGQLWAYRSYIEDESPFSTQQGVKGAEFERVLTLVDLIDEPHRTFSYAKYFGVKELSDTDRRNLAQGKDSVIDRTRRLFYVCCSRAEKDLAVVVFAECVPTAVDAIGETGLFRPQDVLTLEDLMAHAR